MNAASTTLPLQTLGENGQPPASRVKDAHDAREIAAALIYSHRERARFMALIKGMLDGNPPFNAVKLREKGQAYRTNINFMEGESALSSALVPYYDLFASARNYCDVRLYLDNPDDAEFKSQVVTEEFDCLLKKYKAFIFNMHGVLHDFVAFGKGFIMFPNQWGWHFQRVNFNRVFVPDGTEASIEKVEVMVIRERMQLHTLWKYIRDDKPASAAGWNTAACAEAIRKAMPEDKEFVQGEGNGLSYSYVQQRMRDRDILQGTKQSTVQVIHLLVQEFDGTTTHLIVEEQGPQTNRGSSTVENEPFLFKKQKKFTQMREAVVGFFFETLDGSWNGTRGLGHKIYSAIEIKNRLLCKIVDNGFLSGGITVQAKDGNALQKTSMVQAGDLNIIPPGYDIQNAQIFANSQGLVGVNQLLDQTISSNTGIFRAKMEKPQGNPRTAREVEIQYENATVLSNSAVARIYAQFDALYEELYRRVTHGELLESDKSEETEAVREFRRRCKKRGVETSELRKVESVRACRNIGNGSQQQRTQALERFQPFVPMLPESGREHWMESLVASEFGQGFVDWLVPSREKQLMPNDQQAMALLENAVLKSGAPVAWTPTQNNVIHATEHLKAMSAAAESLSQGAEPMVVLAFLEAAGPHTQIHIDKLASDPSRKTEMKLLGEQFKKVAQLTDTLAAKVQQEHEAEQEQQQEQAQAQAQAQAMQSGTDPEMAIKQAQAQHDMQLKAAKAQQAMTLKDQAHRQKLAANDIDLAAKLRQQRMAGASA